MTHKIDKLYLLSITHCGSRKYDSKSFLFAHCINDGSNTSVSHYLKQFPLMPGGNIKKCVREWLRKNKGAILKVKKYVKILGVKHSRYIYHDIQTVPKGDRMHFCSIHEIYAEDKKIKFNKLVGLG